MREVAGAHLRIRDALGAQRDLLLHLEPHARCVLELAGGGEGGGGGAQELDLAVAAAAQLRAPLQAGARLVRSLGGASEREQAVDQRRAQIDQVGRRPGQQARGLAPGRQRRLGLAAQPLRPRQVIRDCPRSSGLIPASSTDWRAEL